MASPPTTKPKLRLVRSPTPPPEKASPSSLDDTQLLAAVRRGDATAAAALYDRLQGKVNATVRHLLGPADADVEDCVQIAFLEIVRSVDNYRGESSLEHWACRVTAHVVYKHIRRRTTERRVFDRHEDLSERPAVGHVSSWRTLVARDLASRVREKLAGISPEKAYAFLLHDVLGFNVREIAKITSVSEAAAQQRLVRGRRELHQHLREDAELASFLADLEEEP